MAIKRNQREVIVEGKRFESMWSASKDLGIPYPTMQARLLSQSERFKEWYYADGKASPRGRAAPRSKIKKYTGCYAFKNEKTGHFYVGSSSDLKGRKATHLHCLRKGNHANPYFQRVWDESEEDDWKFTMYITFDLAEARKIEQKSLNEHWGDSKLINKSKDVRSPIHGIEGAAPHPRLTEEERIKRKKERFNVYRSKEGSLGEDLRYGDLAPHSKPIIVGNVRYPSLAVASLELNINPRALRNRCNSEKDKFSEYRWAKRGGDKGSLLPREAKVDDYLPLTAKDGERFVPKPNVPGLIIVRHVPTGKVYVGASVNVYRVVNEEEKRLKRGTHDNKVLQELYDTQGTEVSVEVVELPSGADLKKAKRDKILELGTQRCCNRQIHYLT